MWVMLSVFEGGGGGGCTLISLLPGSKTLHAHYVLHDHLTCGCVYVWGWREIPGNGRHTAHVCVRSLVAVTICVWFSLCASVIVKTCVCFNRGLYATISIPCGVCHALCHICNYCEHVCVCVCCPCVWVCRKDLERESPSSRFLCRHVLDPMWVSVYVCVHACVVVPASLERQSSLGAPSESRITGLLDGSHTQTYTDSTFNLTLQTTVHWQHTHIHTNYMHMCKKT